MTQETKHTPEPWYAVGGRVFYKKGTQMLSDSLIAYCFASPRYALNVKTSDANAARIVACINACEGMEDPAAEIAALKKQNAEMLQAMSEAFQSLHSTPIEGTDYVQYSYGKARSILDKAIRKGGRQ